MGPTVTHLERGWSAASLDAPRELRSFGLLILNGLAEPEAFKNRWGGLFLLRLLGQPIRRKAIYLGVNGGLGHR